MSPVISFYTTVLRPDHGLLAAHESIARCQFPWEHIVTVAQEDSRIRTLFPSPRSNLRFISAPNSSISEGFNIAIRACSAPVIMVANAGDQVVNAQALVDILYREVYLDFAYGDTRLHGNHLKARSYISWRPMCLHGMGFCHAACATRRNFHERYGYYDSSFKVAMDFSVYMNAVTQGARGMHTPGIIAEIEEPGVSSNVLMRTRENYRIIRQHLPSGLALAIAGKWFIASWLRQAATAALLR